MDYICKPGRGRQNCPAVQQIQPQRKDTLERISLSVVKILSCVHSRPKICCPEPSDPSQLGHQLSDHVSHRQSLRPLHISEFCLAVQVIRNRLHTNKGCTQITYLSNVWRQFSFRKLNTAAFEIILIIRALVQPCESIFLPPHLIFTSVKIWILLLLLGHSPNPKKQMLRIFWQN